MHDYFIPVVCRALFCFGMARASAEVERLKVFTKASGPNLYILREMKLIQEKESQYTAMDGFVFVRATGKILINTYTLDGLSGCFWKRRSILVRSLMLESDLFAITGCLG